ncbi:MAG: aminopeptidase P family protein [Thaumarchaeota archaeon]|nr:aminopeptidase P family protein [Nitrososphaerota archaeon]
MTKVNAVMEDVNLALMRKQRWVQLQRAITNNGLDAVVSFRLENIRYIADLRPVWGEYLGMVTRYCCVASASRPEPFIFAESSDLDRCRSELEWIPPSNIQPMESIEGHSAAASFVAKKLVPCIKTLGASRGRIAVDISSFALVHEMRRQLPDATIIDGDFFLKQVKMLKNAEEIKLLRKAAKIADAGITRAKESLRPGRRECELVGLAYEVMQSLGMERPQVASICASGERTVPLHRMSTGRILQHGDFVFMDIGACYGGYFSDETRSVPVGRPNEKAINVYRAVYSTMKAAVGALKPGNRTLDVHLAARGMIKECGYEKFGYYGLLGHGIGTSGQEAPVVGEIVSGGEQQVTLQAGMVFTLEPGIFVPGVVGIRLEDNVLITDTGAEVLTSVPYEEDLVR